MAFAPLSPELKQKALSIASSYKNGGSVAAFQRGGGVAPSVDPDREPDIGSARGVREALERGRDDDPMGLGDLAREAEEATRGMSDEEREAAAREAIEAVDRERGGDRDAQERAITRLLEEETLRATQDNIAAMQADAAAPTAAEAVQAARGQPDPAKEQGILAAAALEAANRAARTAAPEPQETVTGQALEQAVSQPVEFLQPRPPAAGIEQVAPGINVQKEIDRFTAPVGVPSLNVPSTFSQREQLESRLRQFDVQQPDQKEMIDLPGGMYGRAASGVLNAVLNPTESTRRAIAAGAEPVFADDGSGDIVGAYDAERGLTYGIADERFNFRDMDENLRAAFEKSRLRREQERARDDDEPILPEDVAAEEEEAAPERPPTIDIVPFRPQDFYYFTPQSFAYNRGLPSMMNMRRS